MPPNAAPRGRAPRGGARGRGRAVASDLSTTPAEGPAVTADSTPDNFEVVQDSAQPSPNSSPPDAPTETPASTPARVPVQRLATISRSNSTSAAPKPATASKFKPKNRRRDQEERAKAEEEERQKQVQRNKDAARAEGRGRGRGRGAGRGTRGRGDAMGRGGSTRNVIKASGPFAEAPAAPDRKPGMFAPSNFSRQSSGPGAASGATFGGVKREGGGSGGTFSGTRGGGYDPLTGIRIKEEIPEPIYPDEDETGYSAPRVDIEHINLVSDDEDEPPISGKGKGRAGVGSKKDKGGLRPVRLAREEHKERVTVVNTESSSGDLESKKPAPELVAARVDEESMFIPQDVEAENAAKKAFELEGAPWNGVGGHDDVQIKTEPGLEDEIDDVPMAEAPVADEAGMLIEKEEPPTPQKPKTRRKSSMKEKKPVLQTEEDRAEWERHKDDVRILAEELGGLQTALATEGEDAQVKDKEGRMYLFQFPPILPPLYNPVKKEEGEDDVEMIGTSAAPSKDAAIDLTKKTDPAIKPDPEDNEFVVPGELISEAGYMGKLIVRESGKIELSWGGTSLALGRGADMEFLTTTMIIDGLEDEMSEDMIGKVVGSGSGLGSIKGKFVATPDWDKML